jgi:hypothetical protein
MPHPTWMGKIEWFRVHLYQESANKGQDQVLLLYSYEHSKFAGLSEPLLAYRYDNLSIKKSLWGRWNYIKASSWMLKKHGKLNLFIPTVVYHVSALVRDVIARILHLDKLIISQRIKNLDSDTQKYYSKILIKIDCVDTPYNASY